MHNSKAIIIAENRGALRVAAASARISTQPGTAMEIYGRSLGDDRDLRLIDKVLSSGHKSVIEHQTLSVAFNDVSVLAEQFIIEARLASFTVKSRRYVDFAEAGYVRPEGMPEALGALYDGAMRARFDDYRALMALGVPKEDARFVLPYSLRSNFFMTCDARELIGLICAMLYGRGAGFGEISSLGAQLKARFDDLYPGVLDAERARYGACAQAEPPAAIAEGGDRAGDAELVSAPADARGLLAAAMAFSGRFEGAAPGGETMRALLLDARPRELELLSYVFRVKDISLACLTHFTRHRLQSPLIPGAAAALAGGNYVLPETVKAVPEAERVYRAAFADQARAARAAAAQGLRAADAGYFALSGHLLDVLLAMNARELLHFMKLRTCDRAQWEIRGVARRMLALLEAETPELFGLYGPSCRFGVCPEGRMSCGRPSPRI